MTLAPPAPIDSERLRLRLVEAEDIGDLMAVNGDDEVTRFLPYPSWRSLADGRAWFERMCNLSAAGDTLQFVIVEKASACVIGTCLVFRHEHLSARAELGYVMGRRYWRQGLTTEALTALISYSFASYGLRRLEAEVDPDNIASNRLLCKLGFTHEGRLRQRWYAEGNPYDTNIYGLLRQEWPLVTADPGDGKGPGLPRI